MVFCGWRRERRKGKQGTQARTPKLHDGHAIDDGARLGARVEEGEGLGVVAEVGEEADVVEDDLGVLCVVVWYVLPSPK